MTSTLVNLFRLGIIAYDDARRWQEERSEALRRGAGEESLALLQHPPVYTLGRRTKAGHLLDSPAVLQRRGAEVIETDRGGDVTFHGPGQLVVYPILDLRRRGLLAVDYVRRLEQVVIETLAEFGILGERVVGTPGVWAGGGKLASLGVRVRGGVTTHGIALNISNDLGWFDAIVPCGLTGVRMTSISLLLGSAPAMPVVEEAVIEGFQRIFEARVVDDSRAAPANVREMATRGKTTW
jgi:lipoyl(octanoyl) transferase